MVFAASIAYLKNESGSRLVDAAVFIVERLQREVDACPFTLLRLDFSTVPETWSAANAGMEKVRLRYAELKRDIEKFKELARDMGVTNFAR